MRKHPDSDPQAVHPGQEKLPVTPEAQPHKDAPRYEGAEIPSPHREEHYRERIHYLQNHLHQIRTEYQSLRLQKGGFGFKALAATAVAGIVFGFFLHAFFFHPRDLQTEALKRFREKHQFDIEFALSNGQFEKAEKMLQEAETNWRFYPIKQYINLLQKTVASTKRGDGKTTDMMGFSLSPDHKLPVQLMEKPTKSLVVTEAGLPIYTEGSYTGDKLGNLKKGQKVGFWDRTRQLDKQKVHFKGQVVTVEDYWYEVETPEGVKGWVYGFYTNYSLRRILDAPPPADSSATKAQTPPAQQVSLPANR